MIVSHALDVLSLAFLQALREEREKNIEAEKGKLVIQMLQRLTGSVEAAYVHLGKTFVLIFPNLPVNAPAKVVSDL